MSMPQPEGALPAYTDEEAELVYRTPPPPQYESARQRLQLPVCLPQITGGYDSPFARAYNPQLEASGIERDEFLKFLDALNIAMVRIGQVVVSSSEIPARPQVLRCGSLTWPV